MDDHPVVREGLAVRIASQPDLEVCGEAEERTCHVALAFLTSVPVDQQRLLSLVEESTAGGLDLIGRIKEHQRAVRVLVWWMYPENLYAERALRAGAQGYLHKGRATDRLLDAIRAVLAGKVYVSEERQRLPAPCDRQLRSEPFANRPAPAATSARDDRAGPDDRTDRTLDERQHKNRGNLPRPHQGETGTGNVTELVQRATQWVLESGKVPAAGAPRAPSMLGPKFRDTEPPNESPQPPTALRSAPLWLSDDSV